MLYITYCDKLILSFASTKSGRAFVLFEKRFVCCLVSFFNGQVYLFTGLLKVFSQIKVVYRIGQGATSGRIFIAKAFMWGLGFLWISQMKAIIDGGIFDI